MLAVVTINECAATLKLECAGIEAYSKIPSCECAGIEAYILKVVQNFLETVL